MTTRAPSPCSAEEATQGKPTDDARLTDERMAQIKRFAHTCPYAVYRLMFNDLLAALRASQAERDGARETARKEFYEAAVIAAHRAEAAERERDALREALQNTMPFIAALAAWERYNGTLACLTPSDIPTLISIFVDRPSPRNLEEIMVTALAPRQPVKEE